MHTEGPYVRAGFAPQPDNAQVAFLVKLEEFAFVDGPDAELSFDSRYEGWSLKESTREGFDSPLQTAGFVQGGVETHHPHVLFAGALLGLDKPRGPIQTDNETPRHLGVECARVARLFESEYPFDPRHDFV